VRFRAESLQARDLSGSAWKEGRIGRAGGGIKPWSVSQGGTVTVHQLNCFVCMEEVEVTDYTSDSMTGDDIWVGSVGLDLDDLLDFPRLGSEMPLPENMVMESPLSGLSPSEVITSPGQPPCDPPPTCTGEQRVDLLGDASWREVGVFFSNALGFLAVIFLKEGLQL